MQWNGEKNAGFSNTSSPLPLAVNADYDHVNFEVRFPYMDVLECDV
jgi:hypothetical protein